MALTDYTIDTSGTPQDVQRRQRLSEMLMQHGMDSTPAAGGKGGGWITALNRGLAGALGGYERRQADSMDREGRAAANAQFASFPGASSAAGPASVASMGATPASLGGAPSEQPKPSGAQNNSVPGITDSPWYLTDSNSGPSPLDPPSGDDRRKMMATILGEENTPAGQAGVASVIRNRVADGNYGGMTPSAVVTAKNQFEPWNTEAGRARMAAALADPKQAAAADAAIKAAYGEGGKAPEDPTEGKTMFYSPGAQAALGRAPPSWAKGEGQMLGKTMFYDDNSDTPANAQPAQGALPVQTPAGPQFAQNGGNGADVRTWALNVLQNPRSTPVQQQFAKEALSSLQKQETHTQETDKDGNIWDVNKQTGQKTIALKAENDPKWGVVGRDNSGQPIYGYPPTREEAAAQAKRAPPPDTSIDTSTLTGDEFLKALPRGEADIVKKIAEYDIDPKSLSTKGGHREDLLKKVSQYDSDYSEPLYSSRKAAIKEFGAGGPSSPAGQITAGNTAILHAGEMSDALEKLKKGNSGVLGTIGEAGIPFASYYAQKAHNAGITGTGTEEAKALSEFRTAKNHFSEEVTKFYAGSGGSESERERALANIDEAKSLPELQSAIQQEARLMGGKINTLQDRIKTAMGPSAWKRAMKEAGGQFPIVQQQSADSLAKIEKRAAGGEAAPIVPKLEVGQSHTDGDVTITKLAH